MDTKNFNICMETDYVYGDVMDEVEKIFEKHFEFDRPLSIGKIAKVIELMEDKLGGKIMAEFVALKPETYAYLMGDGINGKKANKTKKFKKPAKILV